VQTIWRPLQSSSTLVEPQRSTKFISYKKAQKAQNGLAKFLVMMQV
jgi:hypothetical protein